MRRLPFVLVIVVVVLLAVASRTPAERPRLTASPTAHAYLPFVARELRPTATPTITATPIPPFSGVADILKGENIKERDCLQIPHPPRCQAGFGTGY